MFTNWIAGRKRSAPRAKLHLEALEERWVPAHIGVKEVFLPPAASHGAHGIANETPTHLIPTGGVVPHTKMIIIFT